MTIHSSSQQALINLSSQVFTCFAAAISLLFMWISVKARENTTHIDREAMRDGPVPRAQIVPYNAAASANQAVWFFFWLWAYNTYAMRIKNV